MRLKTKYIYHLTFTNTQVLHNQNELILPQ